MGTLPYRAVKDAEAPWQGRHFKSFETAERYAKEYVRSHLNEKSVPRVKIYHDGSEIAEVRANGDNRVWVDIKDGRYPLARMDLETAE